MGWVLDSSPGRVEGERGLVRSLSRLSQHVRVKTRGWPKYSVPCRADCRRSTSALATDDNSVITTPSADGCTDYFVADGRSRDRETCHARVCTEPTRPFRMRALRSIAHREFAIDTVLLPATAGSVEFRFR